MLTFSYFFCKKLSNYAIKIKKNKQKCFFTFFIALLTHSRRGVKIKVKIVRKRKMEKEDFKKEYFALLSEKYPTARAAAAEIINLEAIMRLPKGTEHFMSDLHGEYEAFCHIMNNCSGVIREKVEQLYGNTMTEKERDEFATFVYYPQALIAEMKGKTDDLKDWYLVQLHRLVELCRNVASKYTRSKVRKNLPKDFGYVIDELINMDRADFDKEAYYHEIFVSIIELNRAESFIVALTEAIKGLAVDTLHIVGDVFDRGENPDKILDLLVAHHSADIQWGNHDIAWIGAHMGNPACVFTVLDISLKYGNLDLLEDGYGISLRKLSSYARAEMDADERFYPAVSAAEEKDADVAKMRKAIFFMLMKAEGQIISRHPEYGMDERILLKNIDFGGGTLRLEGQTVRLNRSDFVTVDPADPLAYTDREQEVAEGLVRSFTHSEKLSRHIAFMIKRGSAYKISNDNLIFHGCIPMQADGSYMTFQGKGGKDLLDYADATVRKAYAAFSQGGKDADALDFVWYLWCGRCSPLFGREKLTTFERLYIDDKKFHKETRNAYYSFYNDKTFVTKILRDFGIDGKYSHIVNGHVPVKKKDGESPIKAEGKLIVIDGGFCKAYHAKTGIAGYTLIYNSHGLKLCAHEPFDSIEQAIENRSDIHSEVTVFETREKRLRVADTDTGRELADQVEGLKSLLQYYSDSASSADRQA